MNIKRNIKKVKFILIPIILLLFIVTSFSESLITHFTPMLNNIGKNSIIKNLQNYNSLETTHFIVRYKEKNIDDAIITAKIAEKYYKDVTEMYGHNPKHKVDMIIYDNAEEMLKNTNLKEDIPPIGVYYSGIIHILQPEKWIDDEKNLYEIYEQEGPVVHEFAHLIIDEITKGNYPLWLTEGLALYTEYSMTGFEIGPPLEEDDDISIKSLNNDFQAMDQQLAYRKSFDIVKDISEDIGFDKFNIMLSNLGQGKKFNKTVKTLLKMQKESSL